MQVNDALNLVREKFTAEAQGLTEGEVADKYQDAFSDYPVTMEVATHIFAVQLIQHNMAQQMQAQQQAAAQTAGPAGWRSPKLIRLIKLVSTTFSPAACSRFALRGPVNPQIVLREGSCYETAYHDVAVCGVHINVVGQ